MKTVKARREELEARSEKPTSVKARARKRHERMEEELEVDIVKFFGKPVSEWDFEELQAGRPRDEDGRITVHGATPAWITPAIMGEAQRRLKLMTRDRLGHHAGAAIEVISQLMKHSRSDKVKLDAAMYLLNQIIGMPTQHVAVEEGTTLQEFMADFLVELDGRRHPVIEGQVHQADEDSDDEDDE